MGTARELAAALARCAADDVSEVVARFLAGKARYVTGADLCGALCAQVDWAPWFPEKGDNSGTGRRICQQCPVRAACLEFALTHSDMSEGTWGGLSWRELRALRGERQRRELAAREQEDQAA